MEFAKSHEAAIKAGLDIPALQPPEILPGLYGWYEDFFELSTDRQVGMGLGPIPKSSIDRHVRGWRSDDADMFRACIRAMDSVYLAHQSGKRPQQETDPAILASDNPARDAFMAAFGGRKAPARGPKRVIRM